jgi:hypothetical protein
MTALHSKASVDQKVVRPIGFPESIAALCPCCRKPMKLVRTIENLESLPELSVFYCAECRQAEMRWQGQEQEQSAA